MTTREFWEIMEMLDWSNDGENDRILSPVIQYLSSQPDEYIFEFEDIISRLLHEADKPEIAEGIYGTSEFFSGDDFLYTRCVALVNGREYYEAVLKGRESLRSDMEFRPILYVPAIAWAMKHRKSPENYPHAPNPGYELASNRKVWKN